MQIIALEGGMGSGKSTIGKKLQENGYYYFPEAISFLSKKECDSLWGLAGTDKAMDLLLEAENRRTLEIQKLPNDSKIILDRSYYTFLAFEYASKNEERFKRYLEIFPKLKMVVKPSLIIFIDIDYQNRIKRLRERGEIETKDKSIMFQEEFNERLKKFFEIYYSGNKIILNLNFKNKEESYSEVLKTIEIFNKYHHDNVQFIASQKLQ